MNNWLLYCLAVTLVVFSPGPMTLFALTNAMTYGRSVAIRGILGGSLAYSGHLLLAYLVMHNMVDLDTSSLKIIRVLGGGYFLWLAWKQFKKKEFADQKAPSTPELLPGRIEIKGFMIAATNPKAIIFFAALFPQFIDASGSYAKQFVLLGLTYLAIQFLSNFSYSWFGARLMKKISNTRANEVIPKVIAGLLACIGIFMLL